MADITGDDNPNHLYGDRGSRLDIRPEIMIISSAGMEMITFLERQVADYFFGEDDNDELHGGEGRLPSWRKC
jgi:hypothetical protein